MNNLVVKVPKMNAAASGEADVVRKLDSLADEIGQVQRSLSFNVKSKAQISAQLLALQRVSSANATKVGKLSSTLADAINYYSAAEKRITQHPTGGTPAKNGKKGSKGSSGKKEEKKGFWDYWNDLDVWKYITKAGVVGNVIGTIGSLLTKGEPVGKTVLNGLKGLSGIVGDIAKAVPKNGASFDWKKLFGIAASESGKMSFGEAFKEQLGKFSFGKATTVSDKIKVGAKWAGSVLTVATTAYDNFIVNDEHNSTGRQIAETIGESAVKIGGGIIIGAVAGTVGAPAVVTGAITVGVAWAIDKGFEHFTGKGAAEWISDTVLDTGEKIIKNVGNAVGDAAKKVGDAVSGWWDSLW